MPVGNNNKAQLFVLLLVPVMFRIDGLFLGLTLPHF